MPDRLYLVSVTDLGTDRELSIKCHEKLPNARAQFDKLVSEAVNDGPAQRVDHSDYSITVTWPSGTRHHFTLMCASPVRPRQPVRA